MTTTTKQKKRAQAKRYYEIHREKVLVVNRRRNAERYKVFRTLVDTAKAAPCLDCKGSFMPCVMQFDHVPERGPKLFTIGMSASKPITQVINEMAKCDVVCANCHAIRTYQRQH